jgi:hypothetical protein
LGTLPTAWPHFFSLRPFLPSVFSPLFSNLRITSYILLTPSFSGLFLAYYCLLTDGLLSNRLCFLLNSLSLTLARASLSLRSSFLAPFFLTRLLDFPIFPHHASLHTSCSLFILFILTTFCLPSSHLALHSPLSPPNSFLTTLPITLSLFFLTLLDPCSSLFFCTCYCFATVSPYRLLVSRLRFSFITLLLTRSLVFYLAHFFFAIHFAFFPASCSLRVLLATGLLFAIAF